MGLAEVFYDVWADQIGDRQRKLLPCLDKALVFWIERVMVGNRTRLMKLVLVIKGLRLETPVFLEVERTRIPFASAEVKDFATSFTSAPHQLPVHEIVARQFTCFMSAPTVIRQDLVAKIKTHHRTYRFAFFACDNQEFTILAKSLLEQAKIFF